MARIQREKRARLEEDRFESAKEYADKVVGEVGDYELKVSQYADERCVARGCLSPDDSHFVTAGWEGKARVWRIPECECAAELVGHTERVISAAFHPQALGSLSEYGPNIATASADCTVRLWSLLRGEGETQKQLVLRARDGDEGTSHRERANFVRFHPMGKHVASSSHDKTWKLWDLETQALLLSQTGHVAPVYPLAFQAEGALLASGDLEGVGLVWDLRSGRQALALRGHLKQVLSMAFLPNSYQVASASDDNCVKIWDLRKRGCVHTVPAHIRPVSDL